MQNPKMRPQQNIQQYYTNPGACFLRPPRAAAKHAAGGASAKNCKAYRLRRRSNYPRDELPEIAKRRCNRMSTNSNNLVNPNAREAMNRFKMEAASEVGVFLPPKIALTASNPAEI